MPGNLRQSLLLVTLLMACGTARAELFREAEPNSTPALGQPVLPDLSIGGSISVPGDVDLFSFRLPAGGLVQASILARGFRSGSSLTAQLKLLAGDGTTVLAQDQSQGGADDPAISIQVGLAGVYFVSVTDADGQGGPGFPYVLSVELEGNGGFDTATPIHPPVIPSIDSLIWPAGDVDFYRFTGQAGQTVTLDLDSAVFNPINPPIKGLMTLYGPDRVALATDAYSTGDPHDPLLQISLPVSGTYYVEVRDIRSFVGSPAAFYQLDVHLGPSTQDDLPATAVPLMAPRGVSGTVCPAGDQDDFAFGQGLPGTLSLDADAAENLQSLLEGSLEVLSPTGTILASDSGTPDPSLSISLPAGPYVASIGGPSGGLCEDAYYQLWIDGDLDADGLHLPGDNCPAAYNPRQEDEDQDGVGDACDDCLAVFNPGQEINLRIQEPVGDTLMLSAGVPGTLLEWTMAAGSVSSNVYRAAATPGSAPSFGCLFDNVPGGSSTDPGVPAPGTVFFYVISGENCGESGVGVDSTGQPRPFTPCPDPI